MHAPLTDATPPPDVFTHPFPDAAPNHSSATTTMPARKISALAPARIR